MRIMPDTCILFSALLWPESKPALVLFHVVQHYELVLCEKIIEEIHDVICRKAVHAQSVLEIFLSEIQFTLVQSTDDANITISDPKDQPILDAAINGEVDILISSDKHFLRLNVEKPRIMTVAEYIIDIMNK